MSKYEFVPGETREFLGTTLRRIRARSNFGAVSAGDVGGWIESEGNLAQTGAAWVYGDAQVSGDAQVFGAAQVSGTAQVSGAAWVSGDAWVSGAARVSGDAQVSGAAQVYGDAWVSGAARVSGDARVSGAAQVSGAARVSGAAWVSGAARVSGAAQVSGTAQVSGAAWVSGDAWVYGDAHLLCIGPIGSRHAILTVTRDKGLGLRFTTGCFSGSGAEFAAAVAETHEEGSTARIEYDAAIAMVDAWTRANGHDQAPPEPTPAEPAEVQA